MLYRSLLLYSFFLFHVILVGLRHASCMHSRTYIFYLVRGMRRACTAVLASLRLFDTHTTDNMQQTRYTSYVYCQVSQHASSVLFTTLTSQLKSIARQQCCSSNDHTTHCAALYTAHRSYDTHNATILGDVTAELTCTTAIFEQGGKDRRSRSRS